VAIFAENIGDKSGIHPQPFIKNGNIAKSNKCRFGSWVHRGPGGAKARLAFINADWRDFQNTPAMAETHKGGILINDYLEILNKTGWYHTHIIQAPMSSQRFSAGVVSAMQKRNILGVISRYVIVLNQQGAG
jgi:septum formation topological specificity factor MinE